MKLHALFEGIEGEEAEEERQGHLDVKSWEQEKDIAANLRTSKSRWHHDRGQAVVEYVHLWLLWVSRLEVIEEAHRCANQD